MKSPIAIASLAALGLLLNTASAADSPRVNGWFPCTYSTYQGAPVNATSPKEFECSEIEVPLCYDGVCTSDRKINLFVKRRVGKTESKDPKAPRKAGILIQGGPGGSSVVMENVMMNLVDPENDTVDYYTFDHRGTGRTEYLECDAAGAMTPGSPDGTQPGNDELPSCIADLKFQYDGQAAAFSTTSAAMDVRLLIDTFLANHDVYPYGMSYGTYLAQRILQLKVPQVKGFIFDGVDALTTKGDPIESSNSHWNQAMKGPSRRLLEFCFDDEKCALKDKITSREKALEDILALVDKLDTEPNDCAKAFVKANPTLKPAQAVRQFLFKFATDVSKRAEGLTMLAGILQCDAEDAAVLNDQGSGDGSASPAPPTPGPLDTLGGSSQLLFDVVVFGERWAQPPPTREERMKFGYEGLVDAGDVERNAAAYCLYTGSTDPACTEMKDTLPESKETFAYKRDKYYDEPLTLPAGVSAVVINGGLDFQTPREFGELLYSKLKGSGDGVMMVEFDYGTHCAGEGVDGATDTPCRDSVVRQFIMNGDVAAVDVSCMEKLPTAAFHPAAGDASAEGGGEKPTQEEDSESQEAA